MLESISYLLFIMVLIYIAVEDFKTQLIDIRSCLVLFVISLMCAFCQNFSLSTYITNLAVGLLFMTFLYAFSLKTIVKKIENKIAINIKNDDKVSATPITLGFVPSFTLSLIIYYMIKNLEQVNEIVDNSKFFLENFGLYLIYIMLFYIAVKVIYIYWQKKDKLKNVEIITGMGDGDVIVLTIVASLINISLFIFILFLSMIVHLLYYLSMYLKNFNKWRFNKDV